MVTGVKSKVYQPIATIAVTDVKTHLQVIVVMAFSFRSQALRVKIVKVLTTDLNKTDVMVL